jgi:hypothetical protein
MHAPLSVMFVSPSFTLLFATSHRLQLVKSQKLHQLLVYYNNQQHNVRVQSLESDQGPHGSWTIATPQASPFCVKAGFGGGILHLAGQGSTQ